MKHILTMVAVVCMVGAAVAQDEVKKETVKLTGTVVVAKDAEGNVSSAALKTGEGDAAKTVAIKLDDNGKALAAAAGEKTVKVTGVIEATEAGEVLAVQSHEIVEEAPAQK